VIELTLHATRCRERALDRTLRPSSAVVTCSATLDLAALHTPSWRFAAAVSDCVSPSLSLSLCLSLSHCHSHSHSYVCTGKILLSLLSFSLSLSLPVLLLCISLSLSPLPSIHISYPPPPSRTHARQVCSFAICKLLIDVVGAGSANPAQVKTKFVNLQNRNGETALHIACKSRAKQEDTALVVKVRWEEWCVCARALAVCVCVSCVFIGVGIGVCLCGCLCDECK
jgi:hypothetical protein